jgi:hypothetical protein
MKLVDSYIIHIYRRDSEGIFGTVEEVASGQKLSFSKMDELWRILMGGQEEDE